MKASIRHVCASTLMPLLCVTMFGCGDAGNPAHDSADSSSFPCRAGIQFRPAGRAAQGRGGGECWRTGYRQHRLGQHRFGQHQLCQQRPGSTINRASSRSTAIGRRPIAARGRPTRRTCPALASPTDCVVDLPIKHVAIFRIVALGRSNPCAVVPRLQRRRLCVFARHCAWTLSPELCRSYGGILFYPPASLPEPSRPGRHLSLR